MEWGPGLRAHGRLHEIDGVSMYAAGIPSRARSVDYLSASPTFKTMASKCCTIYALVNVWGREAGAGRGEGHLGVRTGALLSGKEFAETWSHTSWGNP